MLMLPDKSVIKILNYLYTDKSVLAVLANVFLRFIKFDFTR